jgi:general secretion pathway protein C
MQLFKPAVRPVTAPKQQTRIEVNREAVVGLFGGRAVAVAAASNFQLKGVVVANNALESIAILAADGKPAEAIRVNSEAIPGVTVKEVHSQYVLLSEGGLIKRVELPVAAPQSRPESPIGAAVQTQPAPPAVPPNIAAQGIPPQYGATPEGEPPPPPPPQQSLPSGRVGRSAGRNLNNN